MGAMSLRLSGALTLRFGPLPVLVCSLLAIGLGMLLFARTPVDGHFVTDVLPAMILIGAGAGAGFPALTTLAMSGAGPADAGLASGLVNTSTQVGGAVGLAVLATIAAERTAGLILSGQHPAAALNAGFHTAYLVGAGLVTAALVISIAFLRPAKQADTAASAAAADSGAPISLHPATPADELDLAEAA